VENILDIPIKVDLNTTNYYLKKMISRKYIMNKTRDWTSSIVALLLVTVIILLCSRFLALIVSVIVK